MRAIMCLRAADLLSIIQLIQLILLIHEQDIDVSELHMKYTVFAYVGFSAAFTYTSCDQELIM